LNPYYEFFNDYKNFNRVFPYSQLEMRELEISIVTHLEYRLKFYTPFDFLMMFFTYGIVFNNETFGAESNFVCLCPVKSSNIHKNNRNGGDENVNLENPKIIDEIYQFCESLLLLILEGN